MFLCQNEHTKMLFLIFTISLVLFSKYGTAADMADDKMTLKIGAFSSNTLKGWEHKSFDGKTSYTLIPDPAPGIKRTVLKATSHATASGLFRKRRIDLEKTPWIHWSWKTKQLFSNIDENEKHGDDFVARLYIVIDGGIFFWNSRALNYVWSSSHQTGETWPNPYTSRATMLAVESGASRLNQWRYYKHNVREDFRQLIGKDIRYIDAIAIMTDSDNHGQKATTYFGDIFFTAQ